MLRIMCVFPCNALHNSGLDLGQCKSLNSLYSLLRKQEAGRAYLFLEGRNIPVVSAI